jgi:FADH2 O2-dependent halogenase
LKGLPTDCDLAIVGSGFGGSVFAMIAARLGHRVMLFERGRHPRFAIGESASPLAGVLIEQLADRYDLPRLRPLSAYGTWQRAYPEVVCGLKRGFTYFRHEPGHTYQPQVDRSNQLLVAASPTDEVSDTHWLRSDVDHFLVREAMAIGVNYIDRAELDRIDWNDASPVLSGTRRGKRLCLRARFIVDASGPNGFLSRALNIRNAGFDGYPHTQALFCHFTGVARCDEMPEYGFSPARSPEAALPPFPPDDAALHHVFDGGWMWVLRFGNGVTSAGVAVTDELAADIRLADGEPAWRRLLARFPSIAAQFATATPIRAFTWMPRLAWRTEQASGPGWAMLPSAGAFVDPLFSTGIPLTLLGIERMARILEGGPSLGADVSAKAAGPLWDEYNEVTLAEADHTARFIAGCYAAFPRFDRFAAYSMFYFAAASFSEMARRLGVQPAPGAVERIVPNPAEGRFLCSHDEAYRRDTARLSPQRVLPYPDYAADVARAIATMNIAGLCEPAKRNWYGIDLEDAALRWRVRLRRTRL